MENGCEWSVESVVQRRTVRVANHMQDVHLFNRKLKRAQNCLKQANAEYSVTHYNWPTKILLLFFFIISHLFSENIIL